MTRFTFNGAVKVFGALFCKEWSASTYAISKQKAEANLKYRFRKEFGKERNVPISFEGIWTTA